MPWGLVDWLDRAAQSDEGLRFVDRRENDRWLSWTDLRRRADLGCARLQRLGIEPGDRVALVYPTCEAFFEGFFGALIAGAVPVPLYPPVRLGRLDEYHNQTTALLRAVGARVVLADRRVRRLLGPSTLAAQPTFGCRTLDELDGGPPETVRRNPEAPALIQFSSGTTVTPKPVVLSERALIAQTQTLNSFWPDTENSGEGNSTDRLGTETVRQSGVSWLPLYHDMGLIGCILPALERPATLTLIPPELFVASPAIWLRTLSRTRATLSPAPNFAYSLCVDRVTDDQIADIDLSHWRVALNGAEAVAPNVLRRFVDRFAPFGFRPEALTPVYGLSEAALAVTFSELSEPFRSHRFEANTLAATRSAKKSDSEDGVEIASVGRPLPGFEISIRAADGSNCPAGVIGTVWASGPSLMSGYFDRPEATAEVLRDGWLNTGDLGFLFEGELYLSGRAKDLIIHRGKNYSPELVEQSIDELAGIRRGCSVAASAMPAGGERETVLLFVEHHKNAPPEEIETLPERCRTAVLTATGIAVDEVHVLVPGTLPRTSSGKLRRGRTLTLLREGTLQPPHNVTPWLVARSLFDSHLAFRKWRARDKQTAKEAAQGKQSEI